MVGVVVEHPDAALAAGELEAAVNARRIRRAPRRSRRSPAPASRAATQRRKRVERHVLPGTPSRTVRARSSPASWNCTTPPDVLGSQPSSSAADLDAVDSRRRADFRSRSTRTPARVPTRATRRGRAPPIPDRRGRPPGCRRDDARREVVEHLHVGLDAAEVVEVIGLDVGHHDHVGVVLQQRPVALVGLGHEHVAGAVVGSWCRPRSARRRRRTTDRTRSAAERPPASTSSTSCRGCPRPAQCGGPRIRVASTAGRSRTGMPRSRGLDQFRIVLGDGGVGGDHDGRSAVEHVESRAS